MFNFLITLKNHIITLHLPQNYTKSLYLMLKKRVIIHTNLIKLLVQINYDNNIFLLFGHNLLTFNFPICSTITVQL